MHRKVLLSFAVLLGLTAVAQAVPSIVVGNYTFAQNSGLHDIPVFAVGGPGDFLSGLNFVAMTGDGGPSTTENVNDPNQDGSGHGVVPAPNITANIETDTSAFGPTILTPENAHTPSDFSGAGDPEGTQTVTLSATTLSAELSLNGSVLIGIITVNTNNSGGNFAAAGTYHLDMGGAPTSDLTTDSDGMPIPSNYSDGGPSHIIGQTYFSVTDGSITITATPEPSSVVLALIAATGVGVVALRKRRARRIA